MKAAHLLSLVSLGLLGTPMPKSHDFEPKAPPLPRQGKSSGGKGGTRPKRRPARRLQMWKLGALQGYKRKLAWMRENKGKHGKTVSPQMMQQMLRLKRGKDI